MKNKRKKINKSIVENRDGGSIAIRGFNFQYLYACYILLSELSNDLDDKRIRLEGLDDIDIQHNNEYIQVKTSQNSIDANRFWNMNVLKNNLEVYKENRNVNFKFIHNTTISKGYLKGFENRKFTNDFIEYWQQKLTEFKDCESINLKDFLQRIVFEKTDKIQLISKCKSLLLEKFDLNNNTEEQYLISLLYHISQWSEERQTIKYEDILKVIQYIRDVSSRNPTNVAIKKNFITPILFDISNNTTDMGYFDGKSANPIHIAQGLPVRRKKWEDEIQNTINQFDITVIKSSSGQGKSTLAWQVAKNLKESGYTIYQLNYCSCMEDVENIYDFFQTRLKIGQVPLIVIDGLDQRVKGWTTLAERLFGLPIKIIITSREEDWYRYGVDTSNVSLKTIDISLFPEEAKNIFEQLKNKNKIHEDIEKWQPAWEKVESKGLLIEYVFLLTHGSMIHERIDAQIKHLNKENNDSSSKLEILRIIALSDIMNIKIQTRKLVEYIQVNIGFTSDRGEVLRSLAQEYYLKFDSKYIEGLHPVRSRHLVKVLHEVLPIKESLVNLLKILDDVSLYDYAVSVPFYIDDENKEDFLKDVSKIMIEKEFQNIVDLIDGLMHYEPYNYWKINRKTYDEIFVKGFINLFVNFNPPFSNLKTLEEMNKIFKTDTLEYVIQQKNKLTSFDFENTLVSKICFNIAQGLSSKKIEDFGSYVGLEYLMKWLHKTDNKIPKLLSFSDEFLLNELKSKNSKEIRNFYTYYYIISQKEYLQFVNKNKKILFSMLKEKTDSIVLKEKDNELYIQYLVTNDKMGNLNECSAKRIDFLKSIFPYYSRFHTEAIYLPFPNNELYKWSVQESIKAISIKNLFDEFDIHLNIIWRKTIMKQYSYDSIFEWQEYKRDVRVKFLEFVKESNRLFEYILEGKQPKNIYLLYQDVFALLKKEKEFPVINIKYDDYDELKDEKKGISEFESLMRYFMDNVVGLIDRSDTTLPLINLKDTIKKLESMQNSFDAIQSKTYQYFEVDELKEEENYWYGRLLKTVEFYINNDIRNTQVAKDSVLQWVETEQKKELDNVNIILQNLNDIGYVIYKPIEVIHKGNFKEVVVGVEGYKENDLSHILFALVDFVQLEIDYVNIISIDNKEAKYGFRIAKSFFEKIQIVLDGGEYKESDFGNPLPVVVTNELLKTLDTTINIEVINSDEEKEAFIKIMYDIWELVEYRNHLDINNQIENNWLQRTEKEIIYRIQTKKKFLDENSKYMIEDILNNVNSLSQNKIVEIMNNYLGVVLYE